MNIPEEDQADLTEDDLKQIAKEQMDSTQVRWEFIACL